MKAINYASFFEQLDHKTPLKDFEKFIHINAKFTDPLYEIKGLNKIYFAIQNLYKKLPYLSFKINEVIEEKNIAYINWTFYYTLKNSEKKYSFKGVTKVVFDSFNKVILHENYWDVADNIYKKNPILSFFIKYIKKSIQI